MEKFSRRQKILLAIIAFAFFFSSSLLSFANLIRPAGISPHFDWPDETMNAFFAKRFAEFGSLRAPLFFGSELVRPRSFNVQNGALVPGGFLGLPLLYGAVIKFFGVNASLFATPFLAALALLAFGGLVRRLLGARIALLAVLLAAAHPAVWYYSSYSYLPNVPYIAFLLFSAYLAVAGFSSAQKKKKLFLIAAAGALLGIALAIRTNEILWIAAALILALAFTDVWRQARPVALFLTAAVIFFAPIFWYQWQTFGSALTTGYSRFTETGVAAPTEFAAAAASPLKIAFSALLLPYGFHPRVIWYNFWRSWLALAPWASVPFFLAAAAWFLRKKKQPAERAFSAVITVATVWLLAAYGSWMLADPLMLKLNTIGLSHVRYWLPFVFFDAVILAWALARLKERGRVWHLATGIFLAAYLAFSAWLVFWKAPESLLYVAERVRLYNVAAKTIVEKTEPNAVIITDRTDKEIFPDRAVVAGLQLGDLSTVCSISGPVYVYTVMTDLEDNVADTSWVVLPRAGYALWLVADSTDRCTADTD
ncbi:hypothetical protein EPN90_03150 [Patescibacteria group bacterium]|nr:MAG: hypothetical protein EPN90_03150 [Patescibacteria group bacterium]